MSTIAQSSLPNKLDIPLRLSALLVLFAGVSSDFSPSPLQWEYGWGHGIFVRALVFCAWRILQPPISFGAASRLA